METQRLLFMPSASPLPGTAIRTDTSQILLPGYFGTGASSPRRSDVPSETAKPGGFRQYEEITPEPFPYETMPPTPVTPETFQLRRTSLPFQPVAPTPSPGP